MKKHLCGLVRNVSFLHFYSADINLFAEVGGFFYALEKKQQFIIEVIFESLGK